jgi:hypothetical protein
MKSPRGALLPSRLARESASKGFLREHRAADASPVFIARSRKPNSRTFSGGLR